MRAITVLVIACPHALGLAIPLVVSISTERATRAGVLVKDRFSLERMQTVDAVLSDKTGTLTRGEPTLHDIETVDLGRDELMALAAAAEADSCCADLTSVPRPASRPPTTPHRSPDPTLRANPSSSRPADLGHRRQRGASPACPSVVRPGPNADPASGIRAPGFGAASGRRCRMVAALWLWAHRCRRRQR